jgi:hypothetical protein
MACAGTVEFEPGDEVYLALDLSNTLDLSALLMARRMILAGAKRFSGNPPKNWLSRVSRFRLRQLPLCRMEKAGTSKPAPAARSIKR